MDVGLPGEAGGGSLTISWLSRGETELPAALDWLARTERERLDRMRFAKRRGDFLLGRFAAKSAVAVALELPLDLRSLGRIEIRNDPSGAPRAFVDAAPAPLAISISDRAGWGVGAVRPGEIAIGCDLELVQERSAAFVADYLTPSEQQRLARAAGADERNALANLIWSAKESALKVLRTGLRRDTRSVEVHLGTEDPVGGWSSLVVRAEEGVSFPGWWRRYGEFLLTVASEIELEPPVALLDPPSLASAARA